MKNFLISGGAGFIGSHLAEKLLKEGHRVICLDNFITGRRENLAELFPLGLQLLERDAGEDLALKGPLDGIFHLASPASPVDFRDKAIEILKVNSLGTLKMLELAVKKQARFLLASTSEVYGDPLVHPQTEEYRGNVSCVGERSPYDEGKRFAESLSLAFARNQGVQVRIARIFNTYGPRMRKDDGRVIPNLITAALSAKPLTIYGDGSQTRSFCYVDDLVEGLWRLFNSDYPHPVNLGNDREFTVRQAAQIIGQLTGSDSPIITAPLPQDDPQKRKPDLTKARTILGWEPKIDLNTGLPRTIAWFKTELRGEY